MVYLLFFNKVRLQQTRLTEIKWNSYGIVRNINLHKTWKRKTYPIMITNKCYLYTRPFNKIYPILHCVCEVCYGYIFYRLYGHHGRQWWAWLQMTALYISLT